jgi:hypothetical protein
LEEFVGFCHIWPLSKWRRSLSWSPIFQQQASDDPRPAVPHDEVEAHFAERRAAALRKAAESEN